MKTKDTKMHMLGVRRQGNHKFHHSTRSPRALRRTSGRLAKDREAHPCFRSAESRSKLPAAVLIKPVFCAELAMFYKISQSLSQMVYSRIWVMSINSRGGAG